MTTPHGAPFRGDDTTYECCDDPAGFAGLWAQSCSNSGLGFPKLSWSIDLMSARSQSAISFFWLNSYQALV